MSNDRNNVYKNSSNYSDNRFIGHKRYEPYSSQYSRSPINHREKDMPKYQSKRTYQEREHEHREDSRDFDRERDHGKREYDREARYRPREYEHERKNHKSYYQKDRNYHDYKRDREHSRGRERERERDRDNHREKEYTRHSERDYYSRNDKERGVSYYESQREYEGGKHYTGNERSNYHYNYDHVKVKKTKFSETVEQTSHKEQFQLNNLPPQLLHGLNNLIASQFQGGKVQNIIQNQPQINIKINLSQSINTQMESKLVIPPQVISPPQIDNAKLLEEKYSNILGGKFQVELKTRKNSPVENPPKLKSAFLLSVLMDKVPENRRKIIENLFLYVNKEEEIKRFKDEFGNQNAEGNNRICFPKLNKNIMTDVTSTKRPCDKMEKIRLKEDIFDIDTQLMRLNLQIADKQKRLDEIFSEY